MSMQIEICLWVVITVALPAMVSDPTLSFFTEAQTGVVLAAGTLGSVVCAVVLACAWSDVNWGGSLLLLAADSLFCKECRRCIVQC